MKYRTTRLTNTALAVVLLVFFNSRGGIGASSTPAERLKQSTLASDAPTVSSTPKQGALKASQARFHVGENQTVCGKLVHIHEFAQGLYLNLDKAYPHAPLTIVVWDKNPSLLQKARSFAGKTICVWGEIRQFNGQIQINLNSEKQLQ